MGLRSSRRGDSRSWGALTGAGAGRGGRREIGCEAVLRPDERATQTEEIRPIPPSQLPIGSGMVGWAIAEN